MRRSQHKMTEELKNNGKSTALGIIKITAYFFSSMRNVAPFPGAELFTYILPL